MNKVVVIKASWCSPCKIYAPVIENAKGEIEAKGFELEFLDADENSDFCQEHNVRAVPSTLIFKESKLISTLVGGRTKEEILSQLI